MSEVLPLVLPSLEFLTTREEKAQYARTFDGSYRRVRIPATDDASLSAFVTEIATGKPFAIEVYDPDGDAVAEQQSAMQAAFDSELKRLEAKEASERKAAEDARVAAMEKRIRNA